MGPAITHGFHFFLRPGNHRGIELISVWDRFELFNHVVDLIGIFDNDLIGPFLPQIGKFFKHLFRCPQIQGRLLLIRIAHTGLQDAAGNGILRIEEVDVASGYDEFSQFIPPRRESFY